MTQEEQSCHVEYFNLSERHQNTIIYKHAMLCCISLDRSLSANRELLDEE